MVRSKLRFTWSSCDPSKHVPDGTAFVWNGAGETLATTKDLVKAADVFEDRIRYNGKVAPLVLLPMVIAESVEEEIGEIGGLAEELSIRSEVIGNIIGSVAVGGDTVLELEACLVFVNQSAEALRTAIAQAVVRVEPIVPPQPISVAQPPTPEIKSPPPAAVVPRTAVSAAAVVHPMDVLHGENG